ncbi:MAG: Bifunctional PGK/TIM [Parcubacteria group bacterium GW2011_GWA2_47_16]|nr:MAG: Bifunctional PGK/TIM [Parcubacteria group bacterium GW2011_GWA2_47_16]
MYNLPLLQNAGDLVGKRVLLRLDVNLPIVGGVIRDDFRLRQSLKTLEFLKTRGARIIILAHTDSKETDSLKLVAERLAEFMPLEFVPSLIDLPDKISNLKSGGILFLENIRRNREEVANDETFARHLASLGDVYVNDAFSVSQRSHVSITGIPKFLPKFAGLLLAEEVSHLSRAFNPPKPFVFVLAGANKRLSTHASASETKFPLVHKFLKTADTVFVGGALANDLLKARGCEIGLSKHSESDFGFSDIIQSPKLLLPIDVVVENPENAGKKILKDVKEVLPEDSIFDSGPRTVALLADKFSKAKFVLWNGTFGAYEQGFTEGTEAVAEAVVASGAESIVGGGDTLACISKLNLLDKFSFVSTGGGAMLEFLANETLPGIAVLEEK